jgi:hypothetical protein
MRRTEALVESSQRRRGSLIFGDNLPNFDQGSVFGRMLSPLYGKLKLFGEFGGGFIPRESGLRDIGSRDFGGNGGSVGTVTSASTAGAAAASGTASLRTSGATSEKESISTNSFSEADGQLS